jgi:hypothetical protein
MMILVSPAIYVHPLWQLPLPAIDPVMNIPVTFPCPSLGWIGVYTFMYTAEGVKAYDVEWVDTNSE